MGASHREAQLSAFFGSLGAYLPVLDMLHLQKECRTLLLHYLSSQRPYSAQIRQISHSPATARTGDVKKMLSVSLPLLRPQRTPQHTLAHRVGTVIFRATDGLLIERPSV